MICIIKSRTAYFIKFIGAQNNKKPARRLVCLVSCVCFCHIDCTTSVEIIYLVFAILVSCFFAFRSDLGFFGKILAAVAFSIFGFVGILLGDFFRKCICADFILTSGLENMIYQKLFWLAGPQLVGYMGGMYLSLWLLMSMGFDF